MAGLLSVAAGPQIAAVSSGRATVELLLEGLSTVIRTHTCGELRTEHVGQEVVLCGWVDTYRDHGGSLFFDLRDRYGKTQVVVTPESGAELLSFARTLRSEYVVKVCGRVADRLEGKVNPKLATGQIEVRAAEIELLNRSLTPPVQPGGNDLPGEDLRLKYRYLDLRRPRMQQTMLLRHRIIKLMRDYFDEQNFAEIETPILGRSTPEGARDYLVPSRVNRGRFYALPQSPQLYKQILMVAGYDRYMQIARCFRDEDLRADRQPEFTQLDLEMSFVDADDVIGVIDGLVARLAKEILDLDVPTPLPRMTYDEAMRRFGHDAPDLRFGLELVDCTDLAAKSSFPVFQELTEKKQLLRGINAKGAADLYSRKRIDELTEYLKNEFGVPWLIYAKVEADGNLVSSWTKKIEPEVLAPLGQRMDAAPGDLVLLVGGDFDLTCKALHALRKRFGAELKLYDPGQMHFSWVVEFPMFEFDPEENRWVAMHHPFTAPRPQDLDRLKTEPGQCRAQAYDLVINGYEAGGGTIRIHDAGTQQTVFDLLGITAEQAQERFGFLLDALKYGAPPHGGIALGIDRCVMLFDGLDNIRDCIAFPKTQKATDLMTEAPGEVEPKQLDELAIQIKRD